MVMWLSLRVTLSHFRLPEIEEFWHAVLQRIHPQILRWLDATHYF